jgi:hypothetical protein
MAKVRRKNEWLVGTSEMSFQKVDDVGNYWNKKKIAVDLHGFLDTYSEGLKAMLVYLRDTGIEIHVLSGPPETEIKEQLDALGYALNVHYDAVFSIADYLKFTNDPDLYQDDRGRYWTTDEKWFRSKALYVALTGIDTIFDDKEEYFKYMPKSVKCYKIERKKENK